MRHGSPFRHFAALFLLGLSGCVVAADSSYPPGYAGPYPFYAPSPLSAPRFGGGHRHHPAAVGHAAPSHGHGGHGR